MLLPRRVHQLLLIFMSWKVSFAEPEYSPDSWQLERPSAMPRIQNLEVMCESDKMRVNLNFDHPFHGIVTSKGQSSNHECTYVPARTGLSTYSFSIYYNKCNTKPDLNGKFYENTIVVQYDEDLIEVWDEAKRLRCEWFNDYEKTATKTSPVVIADLDIIELDFRGDNVDCWMEIQHGKGPWAPPISGIVPLGSTLTLVIAINDHSGEFDMRVKSCEASDGHIRSLALFDEEGCVLRPKMVSKFIKQKINDARATVMTHAYFTAFKFPDALSVHVKCRVEICRHGCQEHCPAAGGLETQPLYGPPNQSPHYGPPELNQNYGPPELSQNYGPPDLSPHYSEINVHYVDAQQGQRKTEVNLAEDGNPPPVEVDNPLLPPSEHELPQPPLPLPPQPIHHQPPPPPPNIQRRPVYHRPPNRQRLPLSPHIIRRRPIHRHPPPPLERTPLGHLIGGPPLSVLRPPPPNVEERHSDGGVHVDIDGEHADGFPSRGDQPPHVEGEGYPDILAIPVGHLDNQDNLGSREEHVPIEVPSDTVHLQHSEPNNQPLVLAQSEVLPPPSQFVGQPPPSVGASGPSPPRSNSGGSGPSANKEVDSSDGFPYGPRSLEGGVGRLSGEDDVRSRTARSADIGVYGVFNVVSDMDLDFQPNITSDRVAIFQGRLREEVIYGVCLPRAGFGLLFFFLAIGAIVSALVASFLGYQRQIHIRRIAKAVQSPAISLAVWGRTYFCRTKTRRQ